MTNIENYLIGIENPFINIESGSSASVKSVYIARVKNISGPIIANILTT
jgi:hypothetical protein